MAEPFDGKRILVVDDDEDIRSAIETTFREAGAEIETASDGVAAVAKVAALEPDLLILDMMLPKKGGLLVLQQIKAKKPRGSKPYVIMITANQGKRHEQFAESQGADKYFNKPFRMDALFESAEALLAKG